MTSSPKDSLVWKTQTELQAERIASQMSAEDVTTVRDWVKSRGLLHEHEDNWLVNFSIVAGYALSNRIPVSLSSLDSRMNFIVSSPQGYKLRWVKKLQDSEKEAQRIRDEAAKTPSIWKDQTTLNNNNPDVPSLPGHLQAWRHMLHRPADNQPVAKPAVNEWQKRAQEVLANTDSNVDRAKAEKLKGYFNGEINWESTYNLRRLFLEQRKIERSTVGR